MSTMIDRLVTQGTAQRAVDSSDSRVRRIHVTPPGRDALHRIVSARPEFDDQTRQYLSLDDLRALTQGMQEMARVFAARE